MERLTETKKEYTTVTYSFKEITEAIEHGFGMKREYYINGRQHDKIRARTAETALLKYLGNMEINRIAKAMNQDRATVYASWDRFATYMHHYRRFREGFEKTLSQLRDTESLRKYFAVAERKPSNEFKKLLWINFAIECEFGTDCDYIIPMKKLKVFVSDGQYTHVKINSDYDNYYSDLLSRVNNATRQGYKVIVLLPEQLITEETLKLIRDI